MPISYLPHISCTPLKICTSQQDSPVSRTVFTLFFLFFGRPSLSISDQDWGRDFMVELDSIAGQLLVTLVHISRSVQRSKTVQFPKQFSHSSLFFGGPVLSITDQDCGRDFAGETDSIEEQLLVTHLRHLSQTFATHLLYTISYSSARQSSFRNSFQTLLFVFWWTTS